MCAFFPSRCETLAGIGRILYSLLEHSFYVREAEEGADDKDMKRGVMAFRPLVAPIKCAVFPLSSQAAFFPLCGEVMEAFGKLHLRSVFFFVRVRSRARYFHILSNRYLLLFLFSSSSRRGRESGAVLPPWRSERSHANELEAVPRRSRLVPRNSQPFLLPLSILLSLCPSPLLPHRISRFTRNLCLKTSAKLDASGAALGRRYARMDELGAPFGVTVDFQTVEDKTVTLRERDSMTQIRMPMAEVAPLVARLVTEEVTWEVRRAIFLLFVSRLALIFLRTVQSFRAVLSSLGPLWGYV